MDQTRWLAYGGTLVVIFVASVAAGAWIARQGSAATQPVAAVATPTPGVSATATASPAPSTASPSPSLAPTVEPTVSLDPATAEEFAGDLLAAFQTGDTQLLADRLHPAVFERYGEQQCRDHVATFTADPSSNWTVVSSSGPAAWSWVTDDKATTIDDAWSVTVDEPGTGQRDVHFAPSEGLWRWFLDCGEPRT